MKKEMLGAKNRKQAMSIQSSNEIIHTYIPTYIINK